MAFYRRKAKANAKAKPRKYAKKARGGGIKSLVTKMVKVQLHKNVENKLCSLEFPITDFNSGATSSGDVIQIIPLMSQGVGDGSRTGNQVTMRNFNIKGHMNIIPNANDVPRARVLVRMLIVIPRQFPTNDVATANTGTWLPYVLKIGNASAPLDGTIQSMYLPTNREVITVLADKKIYMNSDFVNKTGAENYSARFVTKFFNYNFKVKNKVLRYDDASTLPLNYSPSLLLSYCFLDGSPPSSLSTALSMSFVSVLDYEDA